MSIKKIILISILAASTGFILFNYNLVGYAFQQAKGQLEIIFNTVPVDTILDDPGIDDSIKYRIRFIQEVRGFAVDSLGLKGRENYTSFYDQQGRELMWVVTASPPYKLEAYTWDFPLLGSFSYKGFFKKDMAVEEEQKLKRQGYDTHIRNAGGWSTLGLMKDPILSGMLERSLGSLADLIIHELTHTTVFVKDDVDLNENLATFIGHEGAKLFLKTKFGSTSDEYMSYVRNLEDREKFTGYVLKGAMELQKLYDGLDQDMPEYIKKEKKLEWLARFTRNMDTLSFHNQVYYRDYFSEFTPDNTFFLSFLRYRSRQDVFKKILIQEFDGDLRKYIEYVKRNY